jgi:hypothetical protein
MLDAFIIEKIRREREENRESPRLQITPPEPDPRQPLPPNADRREEKGRRGVVEIDFNL